MKKTLLASSIVLALGMNGAALANDSQYGNDAIATDSSIALQDNSNNSINTDTDINTDIDTWVKTDNSVNTETKTKTKIAAAAALGVGSAAAANGDASAHVADSFNTSTATATSTLTGAVTGVTVAGIGNVAANSGLAIGASVGIGLDEEGDAASASGTNEVHAGTFDMSNSMSNVGQSAAGVMVVSQNSGAASLVQQSVNVQANLSVGK
jgi:hypothetical protein